MANLWDVTDKDIDRFSQALLTQWLSGGGGSTREAVEGGSAPGREEGECGGGRQGQDASTAVAAARAVCKLRHLIGAAPVCYGLPTALHFSPAE